jgi:hypothetical protein
MIKKIFQYLKKRHAVLTGVMERLRNDVEHWYPVMYLGEFFIYTGDDKVWENRWPMLEIGTFFYYIHLPQASYRYFLPLAGKEIIDRLHPSGDFNQRIAEFIRHHPLLNLQFND